MQSVILGCGDIGRRIIKSLIAQGDQADNIIGFVKSAKSVEQCAELGVIALRLDLDDITRNLNACDGTQLYYTIAPQKQGTQDKRTKSLLEQFDANSIKPQKIVLISTTGVYGDCQGEWVSEVNETNPQTERGQRRLDSERQWLSWGKQNSVPVVVLRVPGIYANSRLPRKRIAARTPVVNPDECGFTNRIHADDLANMCIAAMQKGHAGEVFNATDGTPGKISEYLQEAAKTLGVEPLPEISLSEAESQLSSGMMSYLNESRKISNKKILAHLGVNLRYPDFREGIKY